MVASANPFQACSVSTYAVETGSVLRIMVFLFAEIWRERARLRVRLRRLRPSVRLALLPVLSGIVEGFPGGRAAEDLNGPLVLLGGDLASGEALPEDLLC